MYHGHTTKIPVMDVPGFAFYQHAYVRLRQGLAPIGWSFHS